MAVEELSTARRRVGRLPPNADIAFAVLDQALASGHYLRTPIDEQCPSGVWLLVPLDRRLVQILDLAGEQHADIEDDEREPDVADEEPSLGSSDRCLSQEDWSEGGAGLIVTEAELDSADDEPSEAADGPTMSTWAPDWAPWTFLPSEELSSAT
jgi:hypothetical protein